MAGIAISIGCIVFLKTGGIVGAVLFTFGLLTVVHYRLPLFTGTAGFVTLKDMGGLAWILLGNLVGCALTAALAVVAIPELMDQCAALLAGRVAKNPLQLTILGAGCGFIMTTAVKFARKDKFLPLLFGVPLFIMAGFLHSIADGFYMLAGILKCDDIWSVLWYYLWVVVGNYLGCNGYKLFIKDE